VTGSTRVTVTGTEFLDIDTLYCRFGTYSPVPATRVSATELECFSHVASAGAGTVSVEISNNNQDYTSDGVLFEYQRMCNV